jgi:hypothetical protein
MDDLTMPVCICVSMINFRRESGAERTTVMVPAQRADGNTNQPPDDGYTWRKYGQKDILGSRYPR